MNSDRQIVIHVIGMQRSGTNYVNKLLELHTDATIIPTGDRSICWKHSLPWERGPGHSTTGLSAAEALRQRDDLRVLLVSKDPLTWWESIATRNAQDLFLKRPGCQQSDGTADMINCCVLYNSYYSSWMKVVDHKKTWHVRYESALTDPAGFISEIARLLHLKVTQDIKPPAVVPYSKRFTPEQRQYYMTRAIGLSDTQQLAIMRLIDKSLLRDMGYDMAAAPFPTAAEKTLL